jgi:hypothetical protein
MQGATGGILGRLRHRRAVAGWQRIADRAGIAAPSVLERQRTRAIELRRQIDRLVLEADARLDHPAGAAAGTLPAGTDWVWRPDPWRGRLPRPGIAPAPSGSRIGDDLRLFHDCPAGEVALRQRRNPGGAGLPPFALDLDVFGFAGSFLSLALNLPAAAAQGLGPGQVLRLDLDWRAERPAALYARVNLCQGPNVTPLLRHIPPRDSACVIEFDLGYAPVDSRPVDRLWLDLIVDAPAMNRVRLRDLVLSRRPRAPL